MQFVVKRDVLLRSLNFVQGIVEKKNTLPILSNVLLELKNDSLSIVVNSSHGGKLFDIIILVYIIFFESLLLFNVEESNNSLSKLKDFILLNFNIFDPSISIS